MVAQANLPPGPIAVNDLFPIDRSAWLRELPTLSPVSLAYLGDAVYELYVRSRYLFPQRRSRAYHACVVARVRAECQAQFLQDLLPRLTDDERDLVRRARNAAGRGPKRADPHLYQLATGFEALVGYLYLTCPDRLAELWVGLDFDFPELLPHQR